MGVNKATAALFYRKVREGIARKLVHEAAFVGEVEADESYFGGARKGEGQRERGRGGARSRYPRCSASSSGRGRCRRWFLKAQTLMLIIWEKVVPDSMVYTDGFKSHEVLDVSEFRHERIDHSSELVGRRGRHINGIESLWSQGKRVLRKYNGIPRPSFEVFLKECAFRFNYGGPRQPLRLLKRWLRKEGVI